MSTWRYRIPQLGILISLSLAPAWLKWPDAPPPFTATYVLGFVLAVPLLLTSLSWLMLGAPGLRALRDGPRLVFALALLMLAGWATLTQEWAFVAADHPGVASNAALQLWLVTGFAIVTLCVAPPPRWMAGVLAVSLVWHGGLGALQVAAQSDIGLAALGEFSLDPAQSGVSVIQAGEVRWLRPYGLLSHPNPYAGWLIVGLMAACAGLLHARRRVRAISAGLFFFGLWLLGLSFSRGAWLGFALGLLAILPLVWRQANAMRRVLPFVTLALLMGIVFAWQYTPLLAARAGVNQENTELRSVADRVVYTQIAVDAAANHFFFGVGGGNFPWYASAYLFTRTDYDLRGDNVHQVFLSVIAELGVIGYGLLILAFVAGCEAALRAIKTSHDAPARIGFLAAFLAWLVIGLFDHYPWTLLSFQMTWLALLAAAGAPEVNGARAADQASAR